MPSCAARTAGLLALTAGLFAGWVTGGLEAALAATRRTTTVGAPMLVTVTVS